MRKALTSLVIIGLVYLVAGCAIPNRSPKREGSFKPGTKVVSWNDVSPHVGRTVEVHGPVTSAHYSQVRIGQPTVLRLGQTNGRTKAFEVVILERDRGAFPSAPEELYRGKRISVTGEVTKSRGILQILVEKPEQIRTL